MAIFVNVRHLICPHLLYYHSAWINQHTLYEMTQFINTTHTHTHTQVTHIWASKQTETRPFLSAKVMYLYSHTGQQEVTNTHIDYSITSVITATAISVIVSLQ
ncbi:hypothetical protein XENOCAPTIV_029717 [Xenoophorus captivus]|uniref:Uncharacterized protein n=1 Tax=Xenoophorus captivus TaxID=1517983 RepID=A0ABV0S9H4_9TELE